MYVISNIMAIFSENYLFDSDVAFIVADKRLLRGNVGECGLNYSVY